MKVKNQDFCAAFGPALKSGSEWLSMAACSAPPARATTPTFRPGQPAQAATGLRLRVRAVRYSAESIALLFHRQRINDITPSRQPSLVWRIRVKHHLDPYSAQSLKTGAERNVAGELGLAVGDHDNRDTVASHLAQQADGEVISVTVRELIDAVLVLGCLQAQGRRSLRGKASYPRGLMIT